jgi:dTDP-4-amino-4,6-dideoxygalactose transaminase
MRIVIPRGIVYHKVSQDIFALLKSFVSPIDNKETVQKFETSFAKYNGSKHCLSFPFARIGIYYALKSQNFPAGSEILMPPITIKAILDVVLYLGLKPVFVDIDSQTLCFDIEKVKSSINENTKAILITYLFGIVPNIEDLVSVCKDKGIFTIEDFSQCLNGTYKGQKVGNFADVGIYSASSIKTFDTYGGGLFVTNDSKIAVQMKKFQSMLVKPSRLRLVKAIITDLIRNFATTRLIFHFAVFPLIRILGALKEGSTIKHTGDRDKKMIDSLPQEWFSKFSSFQANIGFSYLDNISSGDSSRIQNVNYLKLNCKNIEFPKGVSESKNVYWQLIAYFDCPISVQKAMHRNKIDTSTTSLEKISTLSAYPHQGDTPCADRLYTKGLFIPSYPGLSDNDLTHIVNTLTSIRGNI